MTDTFTDTLKVALYGATGTRKTLQIGHLIEAFGQENVGIVSCERGLNTIRSLVAPEQVFTCETLADLRNAWAWAKERYSTPDKWLCVDGGTRVLQWNAGEIWAGTDAAYTALALGQKRHELPAESKPFLRFISSDGNIESQRQWFQIGRDADRLLSGWVRLSCNIYWTFWEVQTSLDQYRKGLPWQVDAPGNASKDAIMGTFDFVARLSYDGGDLMASFNPASLVSRAKVRDDKRGGITVEPEYRNFNLAALVRHLKPANQPILREVKA